MMRPPAAVLLPCLMNALALPWLLHSTKAFGQSGSEGAAAAETLFDNARRLLDDAKYAEACPKLEESQRLDPAVGTLLYLALCYERTGRIASAWSTYRAAHSTATQTGQHARAKIARQHAAELEPRLPKLVLRVQPNAPSDLQLTRNGSVVGRAVWGQTIPVDPGAHVIEAKRAGTTAFSTTVRVESGELRSIDVPVSVTEQSEPSKTHPSVTERVPPDLHASAQDAPLASPNTEEAPVSNHEPTSIGLGTQRWFGIGSSVLGLAGLGIGAGFAARSVAMAEDADAYRRPGTSIYDEPGYSINRKALDAKQAALISTLIGSIALTGGIVIYLTAPTRGARAQRSVPTGIIVGANTIALSGVWQ